jgi:DNA helicase-2/ATP-dependent DNA helicase PcrA
MGQNLLNRTVFFDLANAVLKDNKRGELPPTDKGPHRSIIAVEDDDRVLQILAGPGSGKTEMLVWRILFEVCVRGTASDAVMATTFTRRAATELEVRVVERSDQLLAKAHAGGLALDDPQVHNLRIGTIHSLCDSLLAEFDDDYMASGTELIDEAECVARLAREIRPKLGYTTPGAGPPRTVNRLLDCQPLVSLFRSPWETNAQWPSSVMDRILFIQAVLNQQIETWHPRCAAATTPNGIEVLHGPAGLTADLQELQRRWEEYLGENQILDFATIQKRFLAAQRNIGDHLRHVFVDEFQDNNPIQFAIHTSWLSKAGTRLTVVGDDDQALYRFRGSDLGCFADLEPNCRQKKVQYRQEKLEENHRSTKAIILFGQAFRGQSVLSKTSMPKLVRESPSAVRGQPVRLMRGPWTDICQCVAKELKIIGAGQLPKPGNAPPPSAAVLMFSTSERSQQSAALELRRSLEGLDVRVYNPRNKTAADKGSPVFELMALISYLVDPVTRAPAGKNGRMVEVAASMNDAGKTPYARSDVPRSNGIPYPINSAHLAFQKAFIKDGGTIGNPGADRHELFQYLDTIRERLVGAVSARAINPASRQSRLTLAGLVARLLSFPRFRNSGFTEKLFRQALFTTLLEAHTAPTRRSMNPLDAPIDVTRNAAGKFVWSPRYWNFLHVCGSYLQHAALDDEGVEAFEQHAVLLLTFHQAKGLEFDHVYVAGTGRAPDPNPALRTMLFSGRTPVYTVDGAGDVHCSDRQVNRLAEADRDREVYVALTRPKSRLTVLHDPTNDWAYLALNPALQALFNGKSSKAYPGIPGVTVVEYVP